MRQKIKVEVDKIKKDMKSDMLISYQFQVDVNVLESKLIMHLDQLTKELTIISLINLAITKWDMV